MPSLTKNADAPRILITRLSAIGDCVLTMPLVTALREAIPGAFIAWAVERVSAPLIEQHAAVDQVIRVPRRVCGKPRELWRLRQTLRSFEFDIALDPQSLSKSGVVSWLSGAKRRIAFRAPVGRELAPWLANELVAAPQPHVADRYLQLLSPLGVQPGPARFDVPRCATAEQTLRAFLQQPKLSSSFAVLNPGAGWPTKLWPAERFAAVAKQIGEQARMPSVVVWAGAEERRWAEQIVATADGHATLAPQTNLLELAALLRAARLFVGSDTGPLHLAAAVGVPCVGIYGPTRPEECGPYGAGHRTVQAYHQVSSGRLKKHGPNDAMRAVTPDMVWQACEAILAEPSAPRAVSDARTKQPQRLAS